MSKYTEAMAYFQGQRSEFMQLVQDEVLALTTEEIQEVLVNTDLAVEALRAAEARENGIQPEEITTKEVER